MKKYILPAILFCLTLSLPSFAQKIGKPTLVPTEATAAQKQLIQEGTKLHDQGRYDEAIQKYEQVLKENPTNDLAIYEIALSYYYKKNHVKAMEAAYKLIQYKSQTATLGFGIVANILDDDGKPKEAIDFYRKAIKVLEDDPEYTPQVANLYYNLGVTYTRQKQYKEAREHLKKAVQLNFAYPSPNYLLAEVFQNTKYKVPAMLAAARHISLEINTQRAARSVSIFLGALQSAKKDEKTGNINIFIDSDAPKDEGDFMMYDLMLGTLTTVKAEKDAEKSESEIFAEAVDTLVALLAEDKKLASTFVGKTYIPFMVEMKKRGFTKTFAYLVLQQSGNKEAEKFLIDNAEQTLAFMNWARTHQLAN